MASNRFPNYLLAHRKRSALSQDDLAFLLGNVSGTKVCRYERFVREPGLETILAYELIFREPPSELFAGLFRRIEREVAKRAKVLADRIKRQKPGRMTERKKQVLAAIIAGYSKGIPHKP